MKFYEPSYQPTGEEIAVIKTVKGDIVVKLDGLRLPAHVGGFIELAQKGFYEKLKFFKYEEGRLIKGGCPTTRTLPPEAVVRLSPKLICGIGRGSAGYWIEREKLTSYDNRHERGALVMSHGVGINYSSCQFHFCLGAASEMNAIEPVIGNVVSGEEVMDALRVGDEILGVVILDSSEGNAGYE